MWRGEGGAPAVLRFPSMTRQYSLWGNEGSIRFFPKEARGPLDARHDGVFLCTPSVVGELLLDSRLRSARGQLGDPTGSRPD